MSENIYLVYEKYKESEAVAAIYDTEEEAYRHAEWISEEPTHLESWVEVREIRTEFTEVEIDNGIDIDIDESVLDFLGSKPLCDDYDLRKTDSSEENGGDKE